MTKHEEIIAQLHTTHPSQAEVFQEEIDIIIHKLKFLPQDSFPTVAILDQSNDFQFMYSDILAEKVQLAGGVLAKDMQEDPQVIIVVQKSSELYTILPSYLAQLKNQKVRALLENKIHILQSESFADKDEQYLRDVEILAEIIQPKYFVYGREGEDWVKFDFA